MMSITYFFIIFISLWDFVVVGPVGWLGGWVAPTWGWVHAVGGWGEKKSKSERKGKGTQLGESLIW